MMVRSVSLAKLTKQGAHGKGFKIFQMMVHVISCVVYSWSYGVNVIPILTVTD